MKQQLFTRQLDNGLWQWRLSSAENERAQNAWQDECATGDSEALLQSLHDTSTPITMILSGQQVVGQRVVLQGVNKKYLDKLLPFELEDDLPDAIDKLHLVHADLQDDSVPVVYVRENVVSGALESLAPLNDAIYRCLPDYLTIRRQPGDSVIIYDDNLVIAHLNEHQGFTVEAELAPAVLASLDETVFRDTEWLHLVAADDEQLDELYNCLPESCKGIDGPEIERHTGGFWDWVDNDNTSTALNLRSGHFARRLPFERWWQFWKRACYTLLAAFVLACTVSLVGYFAAKTEREAALAAIDVVFKEAVPNGRKGDPEGQLRSLVRTMGSEAEPSNLLPMLSHVASAMQKSSDITMANFRYNGDLRELTLNLEATSFAALESLRSEVNQQGFAAELLRVSAKGDSQQARMKVTEVGDE